MNTRAWRTERGIRVMGVKYLIGERDAAEGLDDGNARRLLGMAEAHGDVELVQALRELL